MIGVHIRRRGEVNEDSEYLRLFFMLLCQFRIVYLCRGKLCVKKVSVLSSDDVCTS